MKLKYYLRGLGIGIIVTTIILMIGFANQDNSMSDEEIIARAAQLGMVMKEDGGLFDTAEPDTEEISESTERNSQESDNKKDTAEKTDANTEKDTTEKTYTDTKKDTTEKSDTEKDMVKQPDTEKESGDENSQKESEQPAETYTLVVKRGQVCRDICEELTKAGIIDDAEALRKYLFEVNIADFISVGTYEIPMDATMEDIAEELTLGPLEKREQ